MRTRVGFDDVHGCTSVAEHMDVRERRPAASTKHETPPQGGVLGFSTANGAHRQVCPVWVFGVRCG
jgi:hypothetical protein